jgi:hypothetical protein
MWRTQLQAARERLRVRVRPERPALRMERRGGTRLPAVMEGLPDAREEVRAGARERVRALDPVRARLRAPARARVEMRALTEARGAVPARVAEAGAEAGPVEAAVAVAALAGAWRSETAGR